MNVWPLPAELTVYHAAELHALWQQRLAAIDRDGAAPDALDASSVEQVDGAGLQLLLALRKALAERGLTPPLQGPSIALRSAAHKLGLGAALGLPADEGAQP